MWFAGAGLLLAAAIATTHWYLEFDFAARYRGEFMSLCGLIPMGGWERLPPVIMRVVLRRYAEYHKSGGGKYSEGSWQKDEYFVILFSVPDSDQGWVAARLPKLAEARKAAQEIAAAGNLELVDRTTGR